VLCDAERRFRSERAPTARLTRPRAPGSRIRNTEHSLVLPLVSRTPSFPPPPPLRQEHLAVRDEGAPPRGSRASAETASPRPIADRCPDAPSRRRAESGRSDGAIAHPATRAPGSVATALEIVAEHLRRPAAPRIRRGRIRSSAPARIGLDPDDMVSRQRARAALAGARIKRSLRLLTTRHRWQPTRSSRFG